MNHSFTGSVHTHERNLAEKFAVRAIRAIRRALAPVAFRPIQRTALIATVIALSAPYAAFAQTNAVRPRITDRIDASHMVTLSGNTHPLARAQYDQGAAPPDLPMNRMMLVLKRSPEQESALKDLLTQQQATGSATYHKWLTPDQFGQQFGPADSDIQAVTSWLASYGFQSIKISKGRTIIEFSGTAAQVQAGLHASIHKYMVNGAQHWANANDPQIPAALAPVVAGVASLHNFPKRPTSSRRMQNAALAKSADGKPQITFTDNSHGVAPADFNTIYNVAPSMTGSGVTIGVIARTNIIAQDVADFRSQFGLSANNPHIILNGPDPGDLGGGEEAEAVLDATWSGAVAPAATVNLVVSETTNASSGEDLSEFYIIDNNLADVMTESFSVCETAFGSGLASAAQFFSLVAEQATAQGITYLVASGDSGPDSCDDASVVPSSLQPASVNLLAATPFTTAVGATQFNDLANPGTYWNANNSPTTQASAKSYIPENVWNESCTVAQCGSNSGLWSTGGGASIFFTKPAWQTGVAGIPVTNARFLPDVSMAGAGHDGYVLCLDASCQGSNPGFAVLSGTSASVQVFGGVMALVVQKTGARVGLANFTLYELAHNETLAQCNASAVLPAAPPMNNCVFNDVTVGNTNVPLVNPLETGFAAGVGYDQATGLGSVNVSNLVNSWSSAVTRATTTTLLLGGGSVNVTHGTSVAVNVTVAPTSGSGTPTGDVSLIANATTGQGADFFQLSGGSVSSSTVFLPGGTYQAHAHYAGDGTFLGSDSAPVSVTVNPEASQINFGLTIVNSQTGTCTTALSVAYGSPYILTGDVADQRVVSTPCAPNANGASPTGTVTMTDAFNSGGAAPLDGGTFKLNSLGVFEDQTIQLAVGSHHISASYSGDNSFHPSGPATATITITKAATTTAVTASPMSTAAGQPVTITATVSTTSNATASAAQEPSGTVQFLLNGANFGSPVAVTGGVNSNTFFAQGIATVTSSMLANGANVFTAQYSGDSNYSASNTVSSVTVNIGSSGINVSPGCTSSTINISAPGQSGSCFISVTGANGFTGSVTLTMGISSAPPNAVHSPVCSFGAPDQNFTAPNTISLASGSGNATLACTTTAASTVLLRPSNWTPRRMTDWPLAGAALSLVCFFSLLAMPGHRRWKFVPLAMLLVMSGAGLASCGGGSSGGGGNPGTTTGAYTVTITATPSTGAAQAVAITVNVQ